MTQATVSGWSLIALFGFYYIGFYDLFLASDDPHLR